MPAFPAAVAQYAQDHAEHEVGEKDREQAGKELAKNMGVSPLEISRCISKAEKEMRDPGWELEELIEQVN